MADSTSHLPQMAAAADDREIVFNGLEDSGSPADLYGRNYQTCTGLVFGYLGGRFNSAAIANGTVTATASNTNYVVFLRSSGAVSISTSITNWNNTATYGRTYLLTAGVSTITAYEDHRQAVGGSGTGGGGSTTFLGLTDVPASYASQTLKVVRVNAGETALEFATDLRVPAIQTVASSATVTPTFSDDMVLITAQAVGLTLANPTGTAINALGIVIRIKDDGTSRSIAYGTQYRAIGVTLPTATVISKTLYLAMVFNNTDTKWDVLAVGQEA